MSPSVEPEDGMTVKEVWVVTWFPPTGDRQWANADEDKARAKAASEDVAEWHPLLEHRITTTIVVSELVPL